MRCTSFGIWLDNGWKDARITRNVFIGNAMASVFLELGDGPCTIDNNIIAYMCTIGVARTSSQIMLVLWTKCGLERLEPLRVHDASPL